MAGSARLEDRLQAAVDRHYAAFAGAWCRGSRITCWRRGTTSTGPPTRPGSRRRSSPSAGACTGSPCSGWIDYLGGARTGNFRRLDQPVRDFDGEPGVAAWMAAAERPWWAYNSTDQRRRHRDLPAPAALGVGESGHRGGRGRLEEPDRGDGPGRGPAHRRATRTTAPASPGRSIIVTQHGRRELPRGGCPTAASMRLDQGRLRRRIGCGPGRGRRRHPASRWRWRRGTRITTSRTSS